MRQKMILHMEEYAAYHAHPMNRLTHKVAIPLIVFHVVVMLDWVALGSLSLAGHPVTLAHASLIAPFAWYVWMAPRLAPLVILPTLLCIPLGHITPAWLVITIAVVAWVIQFAGHVIWEKRSPAFFTNILQLLVGPLFFVAAATGAWPRARDEKG